MKMADDYARFLQQTPWYSYDFDAAVDGLWELPVASSFLRGWERRLALGAEWKVKAAYAGVIAGAVATTTGKAQLRIRSVVSGLSPAQLAAIAGVDVISADGDRVIIETPRYGAFTKIVRDITGAGGNLAEIAGNGEVHPMTAALDVDLGDALRHLGRYDDAEPFYREALEVRRTLYPGDNADVAQAPRSWSLAPALHRGGAGLSGAIRF